MAADPVHEWLDKKHEVDALDAKLKDAKRELGELEEDALSWFERAGSPSMKIGGETVYLYPVIAGSILPGHDDGAHAALRALGRGGIVKETVNAKSLASVLREYRDENTGNVDVPDMLADHVEVFQGFTVRKRKS